MDIVMILQESEKTRDPPNGKETENHRLRSVFGRGYVIAPREVFNSSDCLFLKNATSFG